MLVKNSTLHVGMVTDGINVFSSMKVIKRYGQVRVYSDEIPLPDYDFCIRRSCYVGISDYAAKVYLKMAGKILELENILKRI